MKNANFLAFLTLKTQKQIGDFKISEILRSERCKNFLLDSKGAKACKSCRSRQELSNDYLLAKSGIDTAENEPLKVLYFRKPKYCILVFWRYFQLSFWIFQKSARRYGFASFQVDALATGFPR